MYQSSSHIPLIQNACFAASQGIFFSALAKLNSCNRLLNFRCFRREGNYLRRRNPPASSAEKRRIAVEGSGHRRRYTVVADDIHSPEVDGCH